MQTIGADALHPGYGFLSENAAFAAAVTEAGITFVGPPAESIRLMGDKLEAKRIAAKAGVPTIPGRPEALDSADAAAEAAGAIGYPVLLKAQAGGGGRGMRIARDEAECRAGFEQAVREAQAAFGDGRVFVRNTSNARATSKCRFLPTTTAQLCTWASANARSSGATRRSSKKRLRRL